MTIQQQMCGDKRPHSSKSQAKQQMKDVQKNKERGVKFDVYRCPFCRFWHFGHRRSELNYTPLAELGV